MKKLLLLLFAAAYLCVSCYKDNTIEDKGNCTLKITKNSKSFSSITAIKIYNTSSDNMDFDKSINALFKHGTIMLKNGSYAQAIDSNYTWEEGYYPSWEGATFNQPYTNIIADSLPYGSYLAIMWEEIGFGSGYSTVTQPLTRFMYRDIVFHKNHTFDSVYYDFNKIRDSVPPCKFTEI